MVHQVQTETPPKSVALVCLGECCGVLQHASTSVPQLTTCTPSKAKEVLKDAAAMQATSLTAPQLACADTRQVPTLRTPLPDHHTSQFVAQPILKYQWLRVWACMAILCLCLAASSPRYARVGRCSPRTSSVV
jgi:hypothetical protein